MSIVTTEEPVLSTALVMKDLFEFILTWLNFCWINGLDIILDGYIAPIAITEESKICL